MKLILALLVLACTHLVIPEDRFKRNVRHFRDSCPGRCILQDKYREWFSQAAPKASEIGKQLADAGHPQAAIVSVDPGKFDQICTELGIIRTCIRNCTDPVDADKKVNAETILDAAGGIVCDAEMKAKFPCLRELAKRPATACKEQCKRDTQPFVDAYNQYKENGQIDWERLKSAGKNVCLVCNCRLRCRKSEIEQGCQADGYAMAKKFFIQVATFAQAVHAQFGPAQSYPDECKPDRIIEGA